MTESNAESTAASGSAKRTIILIAIGLVGGFLSGAFGVGGGFIMVPLLTGFAALDQRHAAATSLIAIIPTSIAGAIMYGVAGEVNVLAAAILAAGGIVTDWQGRPCHNGGQVLAAANAEIHAEALRVLNG